MNLYFQASLNAGVLWESWTRRFVYLGECSIVRRVPHQTHISTVETRLKIRNGPGAVAGDGTLYIEKTYAQLDFGWTESLVYYLYYRLEKRKDAKELFSYRRK